MDVPPGAAKDRDAQLEAARLLAPELFLTVTEGRVSFDHIAQARRLRQRNPERKAQSRTLEHLAKARFKEQHDGEEFVAEYWCETAYGGCALTTRDRLLSVLNRFDSDLVVTEASIKQLARDLERVLGNRANAIDRVDTIGALYSVMTRVMAVADRLEAPGIDPADQQAALAGLREEWVLAQRRVSVLVQRQARFEYLTGVILGLIPCLAAFSLLGAIAGARWSEQIAAPAFLAATLAGSFGAVLSVLQRMAPSDGAPRRGARRELVLDYTAPRWQKTIVGAARPFVGSVFAAVVYFALLGGLLTIQGTGSQTQDTPATFAFFGLMGFTAGFSERFTTDLLERAGTWASTTSDVPSRDGATAAEAD